MREAVIISSSRTPLAKSHRGSFNITRPDDLAAHCIVDGDRIRFRGLIVSPDGRDAFEAAREGARSEAATLGADAAHEVRENAGEKFFTLFAGA